MHPSASHNNITTKGRCRVKEINHLPITLITCEFATDKARSDHQLGTTACS
jgi:hypothetical protein